MYNNVQSVNPNFCRKLNFNKMMKSPVNAKVADSVIKEQSTKSSKGTVLDDLKYLLPRLGFLTAASFALGEIMLLSFGTGDIARLGKELEYRYAKHELEKRGLHPYGENDNTLYLNLTEGEQLSYMSEELNYGASGDNYKEATINKMKKVKETENLVKNFSLINWDLSKQ